jgi:hypothetical protein
MPYAWTDPAIFLAHHGVTIYNIYLDDYFLNPVREYWYGFDSTCADELAAGSFDIRDVEELLPPETCSACHDDPKELIAALIDNGCITSHGILIDDVLYDNSCSIREAVMAFVARNQPQCQGDDHDV